MINAIIFFITLAFIPLTSLALIVAIIVDMTRGTKEKGERMNIDEG